MKRRDNLPKLYSLDGGVNAAGMLSFQNDLFKSGAIVSAAVATGVSITGATGVGLNIEGTPTSYGIQITATTGSAIGIFAGTIDYGINIAGSGTTGTGVVIGSCTTAAILIYGACDEGITITGVCTTAINVTGGPINVTLTQTLATPGTVRSIYGKNVTRGTSQTSGNLVGVRGEVNITAGCAVSTSYLYGTQGKLITNASTLTSGTFAGVYGQLDVSSATINGGKIAALSADIYGFTSGSSNYIDGVYVEHVAGGVINSMFKAIAKSNYVFDLASNTHTQMGVTGAATTAAGWLKINVEGSTRYINLWSTAP